MKKTYIFLGLLIFVIGVPLAACSQPSGNQAAQVPGRKTPSDQTTQAPGNELFMPLISRKVPAFASPGYYPASNANDDSYDTTWRSQGTPAWLAYNLSSVPTAQRGKVLVVWYNETYDYNHTINGDYAYNMPQDYTIDVNPAPGGSSPPSGGWVTVTSVKGNHYHSREHVVDMAGNDWIRINVTAVDGSIQNFDASINLDIYDASHSPADDWIFFGDSITAGAMGHSTAGGTKAFAQLINAQAPNHFPAEEAGGIGYLTSADGAKNINTWLQLFPGKYVGLSYGTNDANGCVDPDNFYNNYVTMVQAVLSAGKIPVVPHIPWGRTPNIQKCGPPLNAKVDALYKAFPQIIQGPDLWAFFQHNQNLISNDNIHPTEVGFGRYRQQWAITLLKAVYGM